MTRIQRMENKCQIVTMRMGPKNCRQRAIQRPFSTSRTLRDVAALQSGARAAGKRLSTLTLQTDVRFANAAAQSAFAEELANTLAVLAARYHDAAAEGGRTFRFTIAGHPAPPAESDPNPSEAE